MATLLRPRLGRAFRAPGEPACLPRALPWALADAHFWCWVRARRLANGSMACSGAPRLSRGTTLRLGERFLTSIMRR